MKQYQSGAAQTYLHKIMQSLPAKAKSSSSDLNAEQKQGRLLYFYGQAFASKNAEALRLMNIK